MTLNWWKMFEANIVGTSRRIVWTFSLSKPIMKVTIEFSSVMTHLSE